MSPPSRQDVLAEIARRFPSEARPAVVKALNFYGAKPSENLLHELDRYRAERKRQHS